REGCEQSRHVASGERAEAADGNFASRALAHGRDGFLEIVRMFEKQPGFVDEAGAGGRERDTAGMVANEDLRPKFPLHFCDSAGYGRLGNAKLLRCSCKTAEVCRDDDVAQGP